MEYLETDLRVPMDWVTDTTQVHDAGTLGSFLVYPRDDRNVSFVIMELGNLSLSIHLGTIQDPLACLLRVAVAVESWG